MSFRWKTILGVALIEAALLLLLLWSANYYLRFSNENQLARHVQTTLELLETASRDAVLSSDLATLDEIAREAESMPELTYIRILASDGLVLAEAGKGEIPSVSKVIDTGFPDDGIYDAMMQIRVSNTIYGSIEIGLDVAYAATIVQEAMQRSTAIAIVEMLLVALFSFVLGTYLTRQIKYLQEASQEISSGNLKHRVPVKGRDELAQTAMAFNRMAEKLEANTTRERETINVALDGIITADHDGRIVEFNPAAEQIFGHRREDVVGRKLEETIIPGEMREAHRHGMQRFIESGEHKVLGKRIELTALHADGSTFPVEITINHALLNGEHFFVSYMRDISQRLKDEQALHEALDAAKAGERAKSRFLAMMSHEIRTPLNAILGLLGLLRETRLDGQQKLWTETAYRSGTTLRDLIHGVLDYSKLEAGKLDLENSRVDLTSLLESTMEMLAPRALSKEIALAAVIDPGLPESLVCDETRLRQVLINLLNNAIKFTDKGGVTLTAEAVPGDRPMLRLLVEDTGIGIDAGKAGHLFTEFSQVHGQASTHYEGSGLGLAISKKLIESMGGEIGLSDPDGREGSCFWVTLPLQEASQASIADELGDIQPGNVMLLLSDRVLGDALAAQLGRLGLGVIRHSTSSPPDETQMQGVRVVILDEQTPYSIFEALKALREQRFPELLLIRMVPSDRVVDCRALVESGFNCFLREPVGLHALMKALVGHVCHVEGVVHFDEPDCRPEAVNARDETRHARILFAEDSPINQMVLLAMLEHSGYSIDTVANGLEAVEAAHDFDYDLILMDVSMPEMDGIEATARIREFEERTGHIPIIAVTAHSIGSVERGTYHEKGFDDYLLKPIEKHDLLEIISKWLDKKEDH